MAFGDVETPQDLKELNNFLADNSYINGYEPSKGNLFEALGKAPTGDLPHIYCWYRHIASFKSAYKSCWGGSTLPQAAGAKICEERVAAYAAKKSQKTALIAKSSALLDVKPI